MVLESFVQRVCLVSCPNLVRFFPVSPGSSSTLSVKAVSVSFHSLQGAGLKCSYKNRFSRLWAQVQLEQEGRSPSLSAPCFPPQGPGITISASYLLPTVPTQFHVQATNAALILHSSAWGLWLRAGGHLTSTVHSSYTFSYDQVLSSAHVGPDGERGSKGEALPNHRLHFGRNPTEGRDRTAEG